MENSVTSLFLVHVLLGFTDILNWIKTPQPINCCTFSGRAFCWVYTGSAELQHLPSEPAPKEVERTSALLCVSSNCKEVLREPCKSEIKGKCGNFLQNN